MNWPREFDALARASQVQIDDWTRQNLAAYRPRHLKMARSIEKYLNEPRRVILDVGCQNGFFLRLASRLGFSKFLAVDFFQVEAGKSFLTGLPGVQFVQANFNEPGFLKAVPDSSVDCVSSTEVFEHLLNHPYGYLEECWRVLRPGGVLLFTTPNPANLSNTLRLLRGAPITWGDEEFAFKPKFTSDGKAAAFWDIHFREYFHGDLEKILLKLPGARIEERGFIANGPDHRAPLFRKVAKSVIQRTGLGGQRLFSATQYFILKKSGS